MGTAHEFIDVYAKLPHGQTFLLPDGRHITLHGCPVSALLDNQGSSAFGKTRVAASDWEYIQKTYGDMAVMRSGLIFAAQDEASGTDQARDHAALCHGLEPLDPLSTATRPEK